MSASESNDWRLVQINFFVFPEQHQIDSSVESHSTFFAILLKTFLSANSRTLMAAREQKGATLIAWETIARRGARHCAFSLM